MSKKTARNDITRDKIKTKAPTEEYRNGYDRIFNKPKPDAATVTRTYKYLGCANSWERGAYPEGKWRRFNRNTRGTYEAYCNDVTQEYYDVYSD
jgi:hypothetical protein